MKKIYFILIGLKLFAGCCEPERISVFGEALWLRATTDDLNYAVIGQTINSSGGADPNGPQTGNEFNYDTGFRMGGIVALPCNTMARISWAHLTTYDTSTVSVSGPATPLWPSLGQPDVVAVSDGNLFDANAKARVSFHYDAVDGEIYSCRLEMGCFSYRLFGAVRWTNLYFKQDVNYFGLTTAGTATTGQAVRVTNRSHAWGVGPRFGLSANYCVGCGFGLEGEVSGALLVGEVRARTTSTRRPVAGGFFSSDVFNPTKRNIFPSIEVRLGVDWSDILCDCLYVKISAGYLITQYLNVLDRTSFSLVPQDGFNVVDATTFTLDGFYLRGTIGF